jgi:hypothetical protein
MNTGQSASVQRYAGGDPMRTVLAMGLICLGCGHGVGVDVDAMFDLTSDGAGAVDGARAGDLATCMLPAPGAYTVMYKIDEGMGRMSTRVGMAYADPNGIVTEGGLGFHCEDKNGSDQMTFDPITCAANCCPPGEKLSLVVTSTVFGWSGKGGCYTRDGLGALSVSVMAYR